jgi:hypothetical protein
VKLDRRPADVRRRLARLSKPDLIEDLLEFPKRVRHRSSGVAEGERSEVEFRSRQKSG